MKDSGFPAHIGALTVEWLNRVLPGDGKITEFDVEPLLGGYTASVYRLSLHYDKNPGDGPVSLVIKFHSTNAQTRSYFELQKIYQREVHFYQAMAQVNDLPIPICYAADFEYERGDFVLLLEDLSAARPGDWETDPIGDIRIALPHLARLHAQFWGDPKLAQQDWVVTTSDLENPPPYKGLWAEKLVTVKELYRDELNDQVWSVCDKWLDHWDDVMRCMGQDSHTLVHTDVHLEQMFFPTDALPRFVLFDWQNPTSGWAAEDVIHAIVCDLDIEDRREHEQELFDLYYAELCRLGITDLARDRFAFQCRLSLLWVYFMFFTMLSQSDMRKALIAEVEEAGDDLREWIFEPLEAVTDDWNLLQAIDQAIDEAKALSA